MFIRFRPRPSLLTGLLVLAFTAPLRAETGQLDSALSTPGWLTVTGSYRLRYEWMDNTFRAIDPGTDDLLVSRLRLKAEARSERFRAGIEFQDSRGWLADQLTPVGTGSINAAEPLQIYVGMQGQDWFVDGDSVDITLGRFTFGTGSNRFIGEHIYRNTRQGHDGIRAVWALRDGPRLQGFFTNPVQRLPFDRSGILNNEIEFDEALSTRFWGVHADRLALGELDGELYLYGLEESGRGLGFQNRDLLTLGARLSDNRGSLTWEVETAYQFGDRRDVLQEGTPQVDHEALMLHAHIARQFDVAWRPEIELRYDYSTGDEDPEDGNSGRLDVLFGPLRFDFGPTSIYTGMTRSNINSPGLYANLFPRDNMVWMTGYRAIWMTEKRDFYGRSGLRDVTGQSGSFAGGQIETRYRWEIVPGSFRFEAGGALLIKGEFLKDAPLAPDTGNTIYIYSNVLFWF